MLNLNTRHISSQYSQPPWERARRLWRRRRRKRLKRTTLPTLDLILGLTDIVSAVSQVRFHVHQLFPCQGIGEENGTIKAIDGRKKIRGILLLSAVNLYLSLS